MAYNSHKLLESLGVKKAVIIGHSMGGMLAARFAASYPEITERVVIYNPIGLTDVRYQQAWHIADESYKRYMEASHDQLYQQHSSTIHRYFSDTRLLEARVRTVHPHPLHAHAEFRLAALRDGAFDPAADALSRSGGL